MPSHLPAGALPAGALLDERFVIESAVGEGGMAVVYKARDLADGRPAALKLLHGDTRSAFITEHFTREAEILASLRHPHIVSYIAHGRTAAGEAYLAMEWLEGEDLGQRLRRGPLGLNESLRLLSLLAGALAAAHRHGVVHRDLKPTEAAPERNATSPLPNGPRSACNPSRMGAEGRASCRSAASSERLSTSPRLKRSAGLLGSSCSFRRGMIVVVGVAIENPLAGTRQIAVQKVPLRRGEGDFDLLFRQRWVGESFRLGPDVVSVIALAPARIDSKIPRVAGARTGIRRAARQIPTCASGLTERDGKEGEHPAHHAP